MLGISILNGWSIDTMETEEDLTRSRPHWGGSVWFWSCFSAREIDDIHKINDTKAVEMELKWYFKAGG